MEPSEPLSCPPTLQRAKGLSRVGSRPKGMCREELQVSFRDAESPGASWLLGLWEKYSLVFVQVNSGIRKRDENYVHACMFSVCKSFCGNGCLGVSPCLRVCLFVCLSLVGWCAPASSDVCLHRDLHVSVFTCHLQTWPSLCC